MCDSMKVNCESLICNPESMENQSCPAPANINSEPTNCAVVCAGIPEEKLMPEQCPAPPGNSCDFVTPNCCIKLVSIFLENFNCSKKI